LTASNCVVVVNKIDLPARVFEGVPELNAGTVEVSALDGTGFDVLRAVMTGVLDRVMDVGERDESLSVNVRHSEALRASRQGIVRTVDLLGSSADLELVGSELRGAIFELEKIAGPIDQEEVLDRLFAMFCIGK
jgi:tRNA modification GTPase